MISENHGAIHRLLVVAGIPSGDSGEKGSAARPRKKRAPDCLQDPRQPIGSGGSPSKSPCCPMSCFPGKNKSSIRSWINSLGNKKRAVQVSALLVLAALVLPFLTQAGMVDTVQYGQIQLGMKEKEILERLGPPDRIQEKEKPSARNRSTKARGRLVRSKKLFYTGTHPASGQKITTTIILENGKVVDKRRSYD